MCSKKEIWCTRCLDRTSGVSWKKGVGYFFWKSCLWEARGVTNHIFLAPIIYWCYYNLFVLLRVNSYFFLRIKFIPKLIYFTSCCFFCCLVNFTKREKSCFFIIMLELQLDFYFSSWCSMWKDLIKGAIFLKKQYKKCLRKEYKNF